jgi:hypothetical protein
VAFYAQYRYAKQIVNGVQPYEFVRASSVHYLTFNTMALANLATLAKTMGVDCWHFGLRHGFSLKDAFDFAVPHALTRVAYWPWKQVNAEFDFDRFGLIFGDVFKAFTANGTVPGPYSYLVLNREFWSSPDFLARFKGNFIKAVCSFPDLHCYYGSTASLWWACPLAWTALSLLMCLDIIL